MCGICGFVSPHEIPDPALIVRMIARLAHRGPDGSGYFRDSQAALGHTRLAIIDTSGGIQPLANEDNSIWISFNGEIFNYVELSKELTARGHRMKTASDTEVIVHAWEEWGPECFSRFNGQWAIAIWDRNRKELILSRDPTGIVPLHYAHSRGKFLFASEVKALFADPSLTRAFDPAGIKETFTFWCTVAPRTIYEGVYELEPGHWARLKDGALHKEPYWSVNFPARGESGSVSIKESGERLRHSLVEATRLRFLRSDVPVGAYLSGGIDSSVTSAIIRTYTNAPLRTYSLRFSDSEFDEGKYQDEMAKRLGTEHLSLTVSAPDIAKVFPEVIWHGERPILRSGPAPLFLLSKFVRESGYKVVVTGEGSDEMLAGYDIFREAKVRRFWGNDPVSRKRARAAELLYPWMERSPGRAPAFAQAFFGKNLDLDDLALSHRPRWDSTTVITNMLTKGFIERTNASSPEQTLLSSVPPDFGRWDPLSQAQWLEIKTLLSGYILSSQGDRMLMGNSVEGRFPFLDPDFMKVAHGFPSWQKLLALDEKHILKREFADLVPPSILNRP
ncbi:MAG: asparagine synthase (glutamine-hydrolyzing), partial [Deltaproteobacteria bacterium]|nr:asparagine synthase (glutamine-hydrolyzing) [Deltaproteobacteria bacterium]